MAVEGHEDEPDHAAAHGGQLPREREQRGDARRVGVGPGIDAPVQRAQAVEVGADDDVAPEPAGRHGHHVVAYPPASGKRLHGGAQPGVAQLPQQIERRRLRADGAETAPGAERVTEEFHLGAQLRRPVGSRLRKHELLRTQHPRPHKQGGRQAEDEQKNAQALQFGSDNCLSLQR